MNKSQKMKIILIIMLFLVLLTVVSAEELNDCDYKIEILLNSSVYTPSGFAWKMRATRVSGISTNITAEARIEDLNGKIIKAYKPWTSDPISRQKTSGEYSPNLKDGQYKLTSEINVGCNDIDKSSNIDTGSFAIASSADENKVDIKDNSDELNYQQDSKEEIMITQTSQVISAPEEDKSIVQIPENEVNIKNRSDEATLAQKTIEYSDEITLLDNGEGSDSAVQDSSKPELIYESSNEKSKEIVLYVLLGFSALL